MSLQVIGNPSLALQALAEGFSGLPASSGDQILQYYELTIGVGDCWHPSGVLCLLPCGLICGAHSPVPPEAMNNRRIMYLWDSSDG